MRLPVNLLRLRVAELDSMPFRASSVFDPILSEVERTVWAQTSHFGHVMTCYTDTFMESEVGCNTLIDPVRADEEVARSHLVQEIASNEPDLTSGPLRVDRQHWVRTGRHTGLSDGCPIPPCEAHFVAPTMREDSPAVKPFRFGFYTSTATIAGYSMWRAMMGATDSMMYPWPWYTWKVDIDAGTRIVEIVSATRWSEFMCEYGQMHCGLLYPDWFRVAESFDAVHFTLPMIAAAQGFTVSTQGGNIAPGFWDVETTLWLKWGFRNSKLVEVVGA